MVNNYKISQPKAADNGLFALSSFWVILFQILKTAAFLSRNGKVCSIFKNIILEQSYNQQIYIYPPKNTHKNTPIALQ